MSGEKRQFRNDNHWLRTNPKECRQGGEVSGTTGVDGGSLAGEGLEVRRTNGR
jgi:hypothetical protein